MLLGEISEEDLRMHIEYMNYKLKVNMLFMQPQLGEKLEGGRRIDPSNGLIMPWYTSPCLEWLLKVGVENMNVFEYGVGDSSDWYRASGAYQVYGVDHDKAWVKDPFTIYATDKHEYLNAIYEPEIKFDLIVIDGIYRDECFKHALNCIHDDGYIIIDNWRQPSADLEHWPLTEKLIEGMPITIYKEPDHEDWQTAVIKKP